MVLRGSLRMRKLPTQVVAQLINQGASVDLCLLDKKLGDKIKYASKVAENVIIIGENEVKDQTIKSKISPLARQKPTS